MTSCLGIYVEKSLIKYAKLQKDKNEIKMLTFNIEFYDNLSMALRKIIYETNSSKIPISINMSNEIYYQFQIDRTRSKKEIKKSIEIILKEIFNQEKQDISLFDSRFILRKSLENEEKYSVLNILTKKNDIKKKKQVLNSYRLQSIVPLSTSIINLIQIDKNENVAIVNIEDKTEITTIVDGEIYRVDVLENGMNEILNTINQSENLIRKSYEACKNMTINIKESQVFEDTENEQINVIMPVLYKIVTQVKQIIDDPYMNISKVFITGSGTNINNLDLYFQEYILNMKCEILKPFFLETTSIKTSIKEYLEVNSATALALNGLGYIKKNLNFEKRANVDFDDILINMENNKTVPKVMQKEIKKEWKISIQEKMMLRICIVLIILISSFFGISNMSNKILDERKNEVTEMLSKSQEQIDLMDGDLNKINEKADEYTRKINNVKSLTETEKNTEASRIIPKDSIPNMLNKIMTLIPQKVKIVSILNEKDSKRILIEAQSEKYEQLGYFSSVLKTENVLKNIKSTSGSKDDSVVKVTIEGELP